MPPKALFRRRPSYKRKSYKGRKRRSYKGRGTYRKRSYKRTSHRRFPTAHPAARLIHPALKLPERELIKMKHRTVVLKDLSGIPTDRNAGCSDTFRAPLNSLIPGGVGQAIWDIVTSPVVAATGFTAQNLLYSNWQVRGVRCTVSIKLKCPAGQFLTLPIYIVMVPLSTQLNSAVSATTPFNQLLLLKGARMCTIAPSSIYLDPGNISAQHTMSIFTSPDKVQSTPGYNLNSNSWGTDSTSPTSLPKFFMGVCYENTGFTAGDLQLEFETTYTFSVMWFNRKLTPLTLEHPEEVKTTDIPEDMTEEEMDSLPEAMAKATVIDTAREAAEEKVRMAQAELSKISESKEEKKEKKEMKTSGWFSLS